jgi:gamma-glutamylcyclotransferase (GGCT)/AIG2-like uncharacterized protein YtfP
LFVYGTLRRGQSAHAEKLASICRWHGEAKIHGRLISLGEYPGLLPANSPSDWVAGELWALPDDFSTAQNLLEELDHYEGCHPDDPEPHEYCRIVSTAYDADGARLWCWTYLYPWGEQTLPGQSLQLDDLGT